jgi:hypothetical protein
MKHCYISFFILIFSSLVWGASPAWGQSYASVAALIQKKKTTAVIKTSGIHAKKKEATEMALKSAFDTYFNSGIEGLNDGKPLLSDVSDDKTASYLERFYDDNSRRYRSFVSTYEEDKNPEKLPNGMFKANVTLEIYDDALLKDLERNKIKLNVAAKPSTVRETQDKVYQPTIMVVPYKRQGESYRQILQETQYVDLRNAIARVQNEFIQKGYEIKDVMAVLDATEKSMLFETNTSVESFDAQLINSSGADVYVTVDLGYNVNNEGMMGSAALVAYERASGKLLASKQGSTTRYRQGVLTDVWRIAIGSISGDFLKDMTMKYNDKVTMGNTFVLRISTGNTATIDLNATVAAQGNLPLSDLIRKWLRQTALDGRFHVQGATRDLIIFDEIQIAGKNGDGQFQDANDFALDLFDYIRNTLNIACDKRVDGSTVYITIEE